MSLPTHAGFGTKAIHSGNAENMSGALVAPIFQTSTFVFDNCSQGAKRFMGEEQGCIYTRLGNPTLTALERTLAALEGGEGAAVTASGMGAISSVMWSLCRAGSHVVADKTLYGCTHAYFEHGLTRYGVEVTFIDTSDADALAAALRPDTAVLYLETPANPNLKIIDLERCAAMARAASPDITLVCDNTFATPYLQRPLERGFDVVVHSLTKYLNGHGDVIAGAVIGRSDFIQTVKLFGIKDMTGSVLGPQEAFLVQRGLKTLEIRMQRHCASARRIAEHLSRHPKVAKVYYPGLAEHPGHEVAAKQMADFGGMIAFEVRGGRSAGSTLLDGLKLCSLAVSLGDAETLVEHPASMTHSTYSPEDLAEAGIAEGLVRISVGLENPEDIIADLEQGLARI